MKKIVLLLLTSIGFLQGFANHISGGELFYEYVGPGDQGANRYKITMRLFRDCASTGQTLQTEQVVIGIYKTGDMSFYTKKELFFTNRIATIRANPDAIPCLVNGPNVCFQVGIFTAMVDLPAVIDGYTLTWVRCCRPDVIANLTPQTGVGGTFSTTIPGTALIGNANNSSPKFAVKDTALICSNKKFVLDFGATDADGDSLSYAFCDAYEGGTPSNPNPGSDDNTPLPQRLRLNALPYKQPFVGNSPLGEGVSINPTTGKITGIAPTAGRYVINVCATEWRNGKAINVHRKDFILQIANCDFAASQPLPGAGAWCDDFVVRFSNNSSSSSILSYQWDFGVAGTDEDVSSEPTPSYKYADTGVYVVKLTVRGAAGCIDSAFSILGVYPGFNPDFKITGSCFKDPFIFQDRSTSSYGFINSWKWDFGDLTTSADVSSLQNPSYRYTNLGTKNVQLVVTSSKGCLDSVTLPLQVRDVALLTLPFKDTLICSTDSLTLLANGAGNFNWTPAYNIINPNSGSPVVFPKVNTTYFVTFRDENSCANTDSIKVDVIDFVSLNAGADTTICGTDNIALHPVSNGLQYKWTPVEGINGSATIQNVVVQPAVTTTYTVTANVGKCGVTDAITIRVVPYPGVAASPDVTICYGKSTPISATIVASAFSWSSGSTLTDANSLTPVASPLNTTAYIITAYDTLGCPKPSRDTVIVKVIPKINAFAGHDTSVVANQPLQLQASGASLYMWSPTTGMDFPDIANPVVTLGPTFGTIIYTVKVSTIEGCFSEDDIKVTVFKTSPDIFIPTGFTPNADGRNDVLKPIPVGIKAFTYFRIYNRWGQLLYSTSTIGSGWDGTFKDQQQPTGTYVYMAQATDYLGKSVFKKGTVVLIR